MVVATRLTVSGLDMPPPETTATLVTALGALLATLTVMVIGEKLAPGASTSDRVQVSVPRFAFQPTPSIAAAESPLGKASTTETVPELASTPALVIVRTKVLFVLPRTKLPV